jgi:hypothetical protein
MSRGSLYRKLMGESRLTATLQLQSRRILYGILLYMASLLLFAALPIPLPIYKTIAGCGCVILVGLMLRYFYFLFFKKDE